MASDSEIGPSAKRIKHDPVQSDDVRTLNNRFPKIDNLEHFPLIVLLQIFTAVSDIDLLSLAVNSKRFEKIAKMVLLERYEDEYFTIDNITYGSSQTYKDFIQLFGSEIKSLEAKNTQGDEHWIQSLLNRMNRLVKLRLDVKDTIANERLLDEYANSSITHLTLRKKSRFTGNGFVLSKFRNLKKFALEDNPSISVESFEEVIVNNPALESLFIGHKSICLNGNIMFEFCQFDKLMSLILIHLKELKEFAFVPILICSTTLWRSSIPDHHFLLDKFVNSMKHLESLALSPAVFLHHYELLRRLGSNCKNIKHLKFYDMDGKDEDFFKSIRLFERIESLILHFRYFDHHNLLSLIEYLPFLRRLEIAEAVFGDHREWSFVPTLLQKCQSLEKLIIAPHASGSHAEIFGTTSFFNRFISCIQTQNVKLEVKYYFNNTHIGTIERNEVTWRNKLVQWVGYEPHRNLSNIHLMDLNDQTTATNAKQRKNPFNLILGYLDLNSLQSLSKTNQKCSHLVDSYVKQHSQQEKTFIITNEFFTHENDEYKRLNMFTEHVTNLRINVVSCKDYELRNMLQQFHNLNKLYIYTNCFTKPGDLIVPQVRHLIYDGPYFQGFCFLYRLSCVCPDLETIELKQRNLMEVDGRAEGVKLKFKNLKKFTLVYDSHEQMQRMQLCPEIKETNAKLILVNLPQTKQ